VHKVYGRKVDDEIILRQLSSHDLLPPMRGTGEEYYLSRHRLNWCLAALVFCNHATG
jgi:hypothetical protein